MWIEVLRNDLKHLGIARTAARSAHKVVNRIAHLDILLLLKMTMDDLNPASLDPATPYECRFVRAEEMAALSGQFGDVLPRAYVETAIEKGDECFAIFDGATCAAFGWYSRRPTVIQDDLVLHFDPTWVYMYHGYTRREYRGQRLHALGIGRALEAYSGRAKGMISIAEALNYSSLTSAYRLGFVRCGTICRIGIGRLATITRTRACNAYGARVKSVPRGA